MPTTEVRPNVEQHNSLAKTSDTERRLDEAIEESFPASDPPSITNPHADRTAVAYGTAAASKSRKLNAVTMVAAGAIVALAGWLGRRMLIK